MKLVKTGVPKSDLIRISERINTLPSHKKFFKKIDRIVEDRRMMILDNRMDWAMAELETVFIALWTQAGINPDWGSDQ